MNVIGFNGSPRKDGNTSILIETVFKELEAEGIATRLVNLGPRSVNGCLGCLKCFDKKDGHCVQTQDDLNQWMDAMRTADGIVLGSPVYFANISGQMKCFLDRAWMVARANDNMFARKVGAGVVAARRAGTVTAFNALNTYFTISQMIIAGSTYWNMGFGREKGETHQDGEGLQIMANLGQNMAWLIKSIVAAGESVPAPKISTTVATHFIR